MISATITSIQVQDNVSVSYDLTNDADLNYLQSETENFSLFPSLTDIQNAVQNRVNQLETAYTSAVQQQQQQQPPDYSPLVGQQINSDT
jgi:hypothetical protein